MKIAQLLKESTYNHYNALRYQQRIIANALNDVDSDSPRYAKLLRSSWKIKDRLENFPNSPELMSTAYDYLKEVSGHINYNTKSKMTFEKLPSNEGFKIRFQYGSRGDFHDERWSVYAVDVLSTEHFLKEEGFTSMDHDRFIPAFFEEIEKHGRWFHHQQQQENK